MKKYRNPVIMLVLILLFAFVTGGSADFGGFSGNTDFGHSSSSSGSSDSSSWSSDFGSSSWSSGTGGTFNTFNTFTTHSSPASSGGDGVFIGGGALMLFFIVLVLIIIFSRRKNNVSSDYSIPAGAERTPDSKLTPISAYTALDPEFNADALRERMNNLYVQMQNAWTNKDISSLRPYFTDAVYNQFEREVEMFKTTGKTNYVERIAVLGTNLRGYFVEKGFDHIIIEMRTRIVDYTLDDATGDLISGSKTTEKFMTYELDITRKSGLKTKAESEVRTVNCPNCGAPLSINTTSVCPYCDSVVTVNNEDWAIVDMKGISQRSNT